MATFLPFTVRHCGKGVCLAVQGAGTAEGITCVPSPDAVEVCAARTLLHHPPTSRLLLIFRANIAVCEMHIAYMLGNSIIMYLQNPCIPGK
jgi:hypothetical protein